MQNIYSHFIHNCPNWEQLKNKSSGEWINKLWYIQLMRYYSAKKIMNYYFMVQHGQIEKELCQVKDTKQKRIYCMIYGEFL